MDAIRFNAVYREKGLGRQAFRFFRFSNDTTVRQPFKIDAKGSSFVL